MSRSSVCAAVWLLAGASGCAAGGEATRDTYLDVSGLGTCAHVLDAGDLGNPATPEVSVELGVRTYSAPETHPIIISSALPAENQEAAIAALDAWYRATGGYVDMRSIIGETTCDMPYAVHAAAQGECHLTGNATKGYRVGFYTTRFSITLRNTTAEGRVPSAAETYATLVHEMGHALGLAHADGAHVMNPSMQVWFECPVIRASHLAKIADKHDWPVQVMHPGGYAYQASDEVSNEP